MNQLTQRILTMENERVGLKTGKTIRNIRIIEDLSQNQDSGDQNLAILTEEDHLEHHQESLREVDHLEKPARTDLCQKTRLTLP